MESLAVQFARRVTPTASRIREIGVGKVVDMYCSVVIFDSLLELRTGQDVDDANNIRNVVQTIVTEASFGREIFLGTAAASRGASTGILRSVSDDINDASGPFGPDFLLRVSQTLPDVINNFDCNMVRASLLLSLDAFSIGRSIADIEDKVIDLFIPRDQGIDSVDMTSDLAAMSIEVTRDSRASDYATRDRLPYGLAKLLIRYFATTTPETALPRRLRRDELETVAFAYVKRSKIRTSPSDAYSNARAWANVNQGRFVVIPNMRVFSVLVFPHVHDFATVRRLLKSVISRLRLRMVPIVLETPGSTVYEIDRGLFDFADPSTFVRPAAVARSEQWQSNVVEDIVPGREAPYDAPSLKVTKNGIVVTPIEQVPLDYFDD